MKKINITWRQFIKDVDALATNLHNVNVREQLDITDIIGVSRGGLIPAQLIAHKLDIKRVYSFGVTNYRGEVKQTRPIVYQNIPTTLEGKTVLVIDEVCDTGDTFRLIDAELKNRGVDCAYYAAVYRKCEDSLGLLNFYTKTYNKTSWLNFPYD